MLRIATEFGYPLRFRSLVPVSKCNVHSSSTIQEPLPADWPPLPSSDHNVRNSTSTACTSLRRLHAFEKEPILPLVPIQGVCLCSLNRC